MNGARLERLSILPALRAVQHVLLWHTHLPPHPPPCFSPFCCLLLPCLAIDYSAALIYGIEAPTKDSIYVIALRDVADNHLLFDVVLLPVLVQTCVTDVRLYYVEYFDWGSICLPRGSICLPPLLLNVILVVLIRHLSLLSYDSLDVLRWNLVSVA